MVKIKISFTDPQEKDKVVAALSSLKITKIGKEKHKKGHKNIYIEVD